MISEPQEEHEEQKSEKAATDSKILRKPELKKQEDFGDSLLVNNLQFPSEEELYEQEWISTLCNQNLRLYPGNSNPNDSD